MISSAWFWAFVAMFGLHGGSFIVTGHRLGRNVAFATLVLTAVTVGRVLLVLPFCLQPRFDLGVWNWILGGGILAAAGVIGIPTMSIQWWRAPRSDMHLRTTWPYSIVRHPMYLSEVLWPIGWSVWWGSIYGVALTPIWWSGFLMHVLIEEGQLDEQLGDRYRAYRAKVRGRIVPGLPI